MPLSDDIRALIVASANLVGTPSDVTLKTGKVVQGLSGVATVNDGLLGTQGAINGDEKTLRFAVVDVPGLKSGDPLTWAGQNWRVKHLQLSATGLMVKAFLVKS